MRFGAVLLDTLWLPSPWPVIFGVVVGALADLSPQSQFRDQPIDFGQLRLGSRLHVIAVEPALQRL